MYEKIVESLIRNDSRPLISWSRQLEDTSTIDFDMPIVEKILRKNTQPYSKMHILHLDHDTCHEIYDGGELKSSLDEQGYYIYNGLDKSTKIPESYDILWYDSSTLKIPWGISIENGISTYGGSKIGLFGRVDLKITHAYKLLNTLMPAGNILLVKDFQSWILTKLPAILSKSLLSTRASNVMNEEKNEIEQQIATQFNLIFNQKGTNVEKVNILGIKQADSKQQINIEGKNKAQKLLIEFEVEFREFIVRTLKKRYGKRWWFRGVPEKIKGSAEFQLQKLQKNEPNVTYDKFNLLSLYQYNSIILDAQNWDEIYRDIFPNKATATFLLNKIRIIRNKLAHLHERDEDIVKCAVYIEDIRKYF